MQTMIDASKLKFAYVSENGDYTFALNGDASSVPVLLRICRNPWAERQRQIDLCQARQCAQPANRGQDGRCGDGYDGRG